MKSRILIVFCIIFAFNSVHSYADEDCDQALSEAMGLYKSAKYQDAKDLFVYVQKMCGSTYGSANTWVQKCDQAMNGGPKQASSSRPQQSSSAPTTLSASKTQVNVSDGGSSSEFISITSNKSWSVSTYPASWCQVSKSSSGLTLTISANTTTNRRSTNVQIATSDSQKNLTIYVNQTGKTQTATTSGSSNSSSTTLSLSKTYIYASSVGTTEYITVTCNRNWEIQYPSASMYTVTKLSNTSIKIVINRNTGGSRQDFFNIKTTDGSKTVKVSLSQGQGSGSSSSSSYSNSSYSGSSYNNKRYRSSGYTALSDFNDMNGKWEIDWASVRTGICTGYEIEVSALAFRYSMLKIEPIVFGVRCNFIRSYESFYYQPDIKLVFPWDSDHAVEFGLGPSISGEGLWFTTELGILCHWSHWCSSDFFMRYDGMFTIGASFNICTGF